MCMGRRDASEATAAIQARYPLSKSSIHTSYQVLSEMPAPPVKPEGAASLRFNPKGKYVYVVAAARRHAPSPSPSVVVIKESCRT